MNMKDKKRIVKRIMQFCPYDWAKDKKDVEKALGYWLKEDDMWRDLVPGDNFYCCETGGFRFKKSNSGRRYIETIPVRIYID